MSTPHTRRVLDSIRRIVQFLRESSREAERRVGLSGAQLFVLRTVAYNNASLNPDTTARLVTFAVSDGALGSNTATARLTVNPQTNGGSNVALASMGLNGGQTAVSERFAAAATAPLIIPDRLAEHPASRIR